ncbi:MAG: hypothetical protein IJT23_06915 [Clostridia bacterium]|nr:hypothetical protein [Clostridia bacterium]
MKILRIAVLAIILAFVLTWLGSIAICEYNTNRHGEFFRNIQIHDISGERYLQDEKIKVLKYSSDSAKVYAVSEYQNGSVYYFKCDSENNWKFDYSDTIWSKSGSADNFIWPYIR